jgi:hypothetical protein
MGAEILATETDDLPEVQSPYWDRPWKAIEKGGS